MQRLSLKWRPALWMVLGGALVATLALSYAGLVALRYLGPEMGFRYAAVVLALGIGAATSLLGGLLVRLLLRPISTLSEQAAALRQDPQHILTPLPHYGTRELRDLADGITAMAAALQNREASIRSFTDHVTHELKTPVTAIRAAAELLSDGTLSPPDQRLLGQIIGATGQMQMQLDALRRVTAAREPGHHGTSRLSDLLADLRADHADLALTVTGPDEDIPLAASGLRIVLGHLLDQCRPTRCDAGCVKRDQNGRDDKAVGGRQRPRHLSGQPRPDLHPVLHHDARSGWNGHGSYDLGQSAQCPWRPHCLVAHPVRHGLCADLRPSRLADHLSPLGRGPMSGASIHKRPGSSAGNKGSQGSP